MALFKLFSDTHYTFEGKKEGEEVLLFLRQHWFVLLNKMTLVLVGALLPFLVFVMFGEVLVQYELVMGYVLLWAIFYMMLWYILFYHLTMYILDTWIVTNYRIVDSKQIGFFSREVAELNLLNIQDVSFHMKGAVATMMNYGDLDVQSAGADKKFLFLAIPNPQAVKDRIMEIAMQAKRQSGGHSPLGGIQQGGISVGPTSQSTPPTINQ